LLLSQWIATKAIPEKKTEQITSLLLSSAIFDTQG